MNFLSGYCGNRRALRFPKKPYGGSDLKMTLITCAKCGSRTTDRVKWCVRCRCDYAAWEKRLNKLKKAGAKGEKCTAFDWLALTGLVSGLLIIAVIFGENIIRVIRPAAIELFTMVRDVVLILINIRNT